MHRGKVISRFDTAYISGNITFKVSEAGNNRARNEKQRNVHAFIVSDAAPVGADEVICDYYVKSLRRVSYNPFNSKTFMVDSQPIESAKSCCLFQGNCYVK